MRLALSAARTSSRSPAIIYERYGSRLSLSRPIADVQRSIEAFAIFRGTLVRPQT